MGSNPDILINEHEKNPFLMPKVEKTSNLHCPPAGKWLTDQSGINCNCGCFYLQKVQLSPPELPCSAQWSHFMQLTQISVICITFVEICVCLSLCTDIVFNHGTWNMLLLFGINTELCWVVYKRFQQKEKVVILLKIMVCVICSSVAESGEISKYD